MKIFIYKIYYSVIRSIRLNKTLHYYLFGYRPCQESEIHGGYWDWTTLVMKKALAKHIKVDDLYLDIGTGTVGCLPIYADLHFKLKQIHAVDYIAEIVSSAKKCADNLNLSILFYCSDLFSNVHGDFDIISFNAPYIDIEREEYFAILKHRISNLRFSGGKGGGEVIARFLNDAENHITDNGKVLLGVCHYHIQRSVVQNLILSSNFELYKCVEHFCIPGSVYVLFKKTKK
jgi:release factor glutamine methyltransferase